ncbi:hypothetical protein G6L37_04720 [Agrobacterium rubi]|nr:hypothetical protein [Agrobacterium rubi]NTF24657.1 hypothetical protein [Agrobacterium rubi]
MSDIEADAAEFRKHLADLAWKPDEWADEGEICFEWIAPNRHAIVSIEGDGEIGYAMLVDGTFVSGEEAAIPHRFPADLKSYLSTPSAQAV